MARGGTSVAERISALIADIEAEAYARGRADAGKELLRILEAAEGRDKRGTSGRGKRQAKAARKRRTGGGKRAPKGSVPRFVRRVLSEHPGSTAPEIAGHAADEVERSIKLASVRVELSKGQAQGRYVSDSGRWSLSFAGTSPARLEEIASPHPSPASDQGVEDTAAGPPEDDGATVDTGTAREETKGRLGLNL